MIRYLGILEKEPGTLWGIWFPDLPGCITAGETADVTIDRAPEALQLWVEDARADKEPLPRPRSIEELRQDAEVREALAAGHAVVVVQVQELEPALG